MNEIDVGELKRRAGCTRLCGVGLQVDVLRAALRLQHNGIRLSRATLLEQGLVRVLPPEGLEALHDALAAWMVEHHAGNAPQPFVYETASGGLIVVYEAEE